MRWRSARVDRDGLLAFYERYEFKAWRRELFDALAADAPVAARPPDEPEPPREYETVFSEAALERWLAKLQSAPLVAIDTEIDSLDPMRARLIGLSFAVSPHEACLPPAVPRPSRCTCAVDDAARARAAEALARRRGPAEARPARQATTCTSSPTTASHCAASYTTRCCRATCSRRIKPHDLKNLAERHLGRSGVTYERPVRQGREPDPVRAGRCRAAAEYACEDGEHDACSCTARCGRASRPSRACAASTRRSRCRLPKCWRASSATAC